MEVIAEKMVSFGRSLWGRVAILAVVVLGLLALSLAWPRRATQSGAELPPPAGGPPLQPAAASSLKLPPPLLTAHEWGTFTTQVTDEGVPQLWHGTATELPKFVYKDWRIPEGKGGSRLARGTVRMETPVIYFYTPEPQTVSVQVGFPTGFLTEWYPQAKRPLPYNVIQWLNFRIDPRSRLSPPMELWGSDNHYYAARHPNSAQVITEIDGKVEAEQFLFYRGVGSFDLPLRARATAAGIEVQGEQPGAIAGGILFERRGERTGFRPIQRLQSPLKLARPVLSKGSEEAASVQSQLEHTIERMLVEQGLFPKEAEAMLRTWKHFWFEEGLRVLYLVPRQLTDRVLPLSISPAPTELVRVMVGRIDFVGQATPPVE